MPGCGKEIKTNPGWNEKNGAKSELVNAAKANMDTTVEDVRSRVESITRIHIRELFAFKTI